jgi:hypothetical protein
MPRAWALLSLRPFFQHLPLDVVQLLHHFRRAGVAGQLQAMAVRVEEVDRLEDGVVDRADDIDAAGTRRSLAASSSSMLPLPGQVLHPGRGVAVTVHRRLRRQFEEGQHVAVAGVEEHVHVRVRRLGGWHFVFGDGQDEVHVQVFHVPLDGFFRVFAAVGDVVNLLDFHRCLQLDSAIK